MVPVSVCSAPSRAVMVSAFQISKTLSIEAVVNGLMGKDASARFGFMMDLAEEARELDV